MEHFLIGTRGAEERTWKESEHMEEGISSGRRSKNVEQASYN